MQDPCLSAAALKIRRPSAEAVRFRNTPCSHTDRYCAVPLSTGGIKNSHYILNRRVNTLSMPGREETLIVPL
jgi:hypothetical protein